jgi:hypothetical protein
MTGCSLTLGETWLGPGGLLPSNAGLRTVWRPAWAAEQCGQLPCRHVWPLAGEVGLCGPAMAGPGWAAGVLLQWQVETAGTLAPCLSWWGSACGGRAARVVARLGLGVAHVRLIRLFSRAACGRREGCG